MKTLPTILFVVAALLVGGCQHDYTRWPVNRAETDARRDVSAGVFKLIYGGMPWRTYWAEREILQREHGIELVTTCDADHIHYGNRYTQISLPAIERRFGTNLLAEVRKQAEIELESKERSQR